MKQILQEKRLLAILLIAVLAFGLPTSAFGAEFNTKEAKAVFKLVNEKRGEEGASQLAWDADLIAAAEIRAKEITKHYNAQHLRPDGSAAASVSTKVWGENIAYGYGDADAVMDAWMRSQGHRKNIMKGDYTIMGAACIRGDDGLLYWVQLFGTGKSNAPWAGVKKYTLDPFTSGSLNDKKTEEPSKAAVKPAKEPAKAEVQSVPAPVAEKLAKATEEEKKTESAEEKPAKKASSQEDGPADDIVFNRVDTKPEKQESTSLVNKAGEVSPTALASLVAEAPGEERVKVTVADSRVISPEALKSAYEAGEGRIVRILAVTTDRESGGEQGSLTLHTGKLLDREEPIMTGVRTDREAVSYIRSRTEHLWTQKMGYVHLEQTGSLSARCKVKARVDLDGMDVENLFLYVHLQEPDVLELVEDANPNYVEGVLTFYTRQGGDFVIADQKLKR